MKNFVNTPLRAKLKRFFIAINLERQGKMAKPFQIPILWPIASHLG
jgi:hypothetical protein